MPYKPNSYEKGKGNKVDPNTPMPPGKHKDNKGGHKGPSGTTTTGRVTNVPCDTTNWRKDVIVSRIKFDDVQKDVYLEHLAEHGLKSRAAKAASVSMNTVSRHREDDPDFGEAEARAVDAYTGRVMEHHQNLLFEGEVHKTYDKDGNIISEKHVYPIQLIAMELKRVNPEYREKQQLDITGGGAGGVLVAPAEMTPEEWIAEAEERNQRKREAEIIDAEPINADQGENDAVDMEATKK